MASSLFVLLDDIATLLDDVATMTKIAARQSVAATDDVAVMTKVAAQKTAGVLGDDLALNAQQVTGVRADRELPVVWAVTKGSLKNKAILVPMALFISILFPKLIAPLLMLGGLFLCFEGAEKVLHSWLHRPEEDAAHHADLIAAVNDEQVDLVVFEQEKISGAIRTDFILSAEIIVISLGTMTAATWQQQFMTLVAVALIMTVGVYGLVALIVKLDDMGLALLKQPSGAWLGRFLLWLAPKLMRFLSIAGTIAMFMVGGGIVLHNIPVVYHALEAVSQAIAARFYGGFLIEVLSNSALTAVAGLIMGIMVVGVVHFWSFLSKKSKKSIRNQSKFK